MPFAPHLKLLLSLVVLLSFLSCRQEVEPIPLSNEQMMAVLIDLHIAEAMIEKLPATDRDTVSTVYSRMIFREHGVSQEDFDASMAVLREDPIRLNAIYEEIMGELNVLEATERGVESME